MQNHLFNLLLGALFSSSSVTALSSDNQSTAAHNVDPSTSATFVDPPGLLIDAMFRSAVPKTAGKVYQEVHFAREADGFVRVFQKLHSDEPSMLKGLEQYRKDRGLAEKMYFTDLNYEPEDRRLEGVIRYRKFKYEYKMQFDSDFQKVTGGEITGQSPDQGRQHHVLGEQPPALFYTRAGHDSKL